MALSFRSRLRPGGHPLPPCGTFTCFWGEGFPSKTLGPVLLVIVLLICTRDSVRCLLVDRDTESCLPLSIPPKRPLPLTMECCFQTGGRGRDGGQIHGRGLACLCCACVHMCIHVDTCAHSLSTDPARVGRGQAAAPHGEDGVMAGDRLGSEEAECPAARPRTTGGVPVGRFHERMDTFLPQCPI